MRAAGVLALVCACSGPELPPLAAQSAHFQVHAWGELDPSFLETLETHRAIVGGWLGAQPELVVVALHQSVPELHEACGTPADGCAYDREIHMLEYVPHELVHAYATLLGAPPIFFREGLAELLGCAGEDAVEVVPDPALVRGKLETGPFRATAPIDRPAVYAQAASFFHSLVERHGREAVLALYGAMEEGDAIARIDARMTVMLGEGLDDAIAAWALRGPMPRAHMCLRLVECQAPPLGEATLARGIPLARTYGEGHVLGTYSAPEGIRVRTLGAAVVLHLGSCGGTPHETRIVLARSGEAWLRMPPGAIWMYVAGDPGDTVELTPMAGPFGDECDAAPALELPVVHDLVVHDAVASATKVLRLQTPGARTLEVRPLANWEPHDVAGVQLCAGCPADGTCAQGGPIAIDAMALEAGVPFQVVVEGTATGLGYRVAMWPR